MSNSLNSRPAGTLGQVQAPSAPKPTDPGEVCYSLSLPTQTTEQAVTFLEGLGGDAAGAGRAMHRIGVNAPAIRSRYKQQIETMVAELARRLKTGESRESVARWASAERRRIVNQRRAGSGLVARGIYEVRDWRQYGYGGRSYENIVSRYKQQDIRGSAVHDRIISRAQRSNTTVNTAVTRGASYLRHGGRVLIVVGIATSVARIWRAPDEDLPRVIGEEFGGFVGGSIGAGAAAGVCLVFGIASGGWGLLACGVIGGIGGGLIGGGVGGHVANGVYFSDINTPAHSVTKVVIEVPYKQLYRTPPPQMCGPK